ncbi:MAG TPA: SUMF1/EgtB/PvdO family nonheme iron enzyme [Smithellaceae bacterium]|nr:SUMF1/EgtB/PvdO family nonheme iron enzyme [Smithellaceae bacterium]
MQVILKKIFVILTMATLLYPSSLTWATERRTALIIGNSQYEVGQLRNPVNDATDMATTLQGLGFTVILKKNARQQEMEEAIRDFGRRLKRGGVGLFFYAGHGVEINRRNYLLPIGARIERETDVKYQAIDVEMVLDEMANAGNQMNIVILDACRDNPLGRSLRSAGRGLTVISDAPVGTFITYSTSPGKTAADGSGRNSPYTGALLKAISEPGLPIEQVFKKVRQHLSRVTRNRQIPWELSSLQGDFYFKPGRSGGTNAGANSEKNDLAMGARPPAPEPAQDGILTDTATGMEFVFVKGGCYQMGDTFGGGDGDEKPVHEVCVDDFYMAKHETTVEQFRRFVHDTGYRTEAEKGDGCFVWTGSKWDKSHDANWRSPGFKQTQDHPVACVSWNDATAFVRWLSSKSGKNYRLPTEAEWEYAARSGGKREKWSGTSDGSSLGDYAWYDANSGGQTHPVGQKRPNGLGLHDMSGNVWEWCQDWYGSDYYSSSGRDNPGGPSSGSDRVVRGGGWSSFAAYSRAALRNRRVPDNRYINLGFRLALPPGQ